MALIAAAACVCILSSCKKDKQEETTPPANNGGNTSAKYALPITTGSWWVYEEVKLDSNFNYVSTYGVDSVYVSGDTVVNGITFKLFKSVTLSGNTLLDYQYHNKLVRDSAGYLGDANGWFMLHDNFTDTLKVDSFNASIYTAYYKMAHKDSIVSTPAGSFPTVDLKGDVYAVPGYPWAIPRHNHRLFAHNVGEVKNITYFFSQPDYIERRLVSYYIAP